MPELSAMLERGPVVCAEGYLFECERRGYLQAGADMVIAETFNWLGEALLALEVIRAAGLPAVVTFAVHRDGTLRDVDSPEDACRQAEQCTREELSEFAAAALALGVRYLGICCGAAPHHIRAVAEAAGHTPPASRYSPDMSRHSFLGTAPGVTPSYQDYASQL